MILIFPWAQKMSDGKVNPKNYHRWWEVVALLKKQLDQERFGTHQISRSGERDLGCTKRSDDLSLADIENLILGCDTWISVDSFGQHMAWFLRKPGVVIFGQSDPAIFGHSENINLLKSRKYLRENQFWLWSQCEVNEDAFVSPDVVVAAVLLSAERRLTATGKQEYNEKT